jgi:miniconductance mechanosensitive channel
MGMEQLLDYLRQGAALHPLVKAGVLAAAVLLAHLLAKQVVLRVVKALVKRSSIRWDDPLVHNQVFSKAVNVLPAVTLYYGVLLFPSWVPGVRKLVYLYMILLVVQVAGRLLGAVLEVYESHPVARRRPLKGYFELIKIFLYIIGLVLAVSLVLDKSPWGLLSGIGALTAVLMLIFKDTILSFVASMQIAGNDLFRRGDWISMPTYGADGDVIDVALHTVKVQNFDKTVTSIPTQKFLDHSFQNWRGVFEIGARRIKRSLLIDQSSVGYVDEALLETLRRIRLLQPYLEERLRAIEAHNRSTGADTTMPVNGRRLTNLGCFRAYVMAYLQNHPDIRQDMTLLVRHLQPEADNGLPLEVYAFSRHTAWPDYEGLQADIFDHLLAALPLFGLRAYQRNALVDRRGGR